MSEQKHTPEPWIAESEVIYQDYGHYKAYLGVIRGRETMFPTNEANAARIVECINALADIDNPAEWVEKMKINEQVWGDRVQMYEDKLEMNNRILESQQSENERLKAELEQCQHQLEDEYRDSGVYQHELTLLKAELAKLKGETPC